MKHYMFRIITNLWPTLVIKAIRSPHWLGVLLCCLLMTSCSQSSQLHRLQQQGELIVAMRQPAAYHQLHNRPGFNQELIETFARTLGLSVRFTLVTDTDHLLADLQQAQVHMAVGLMNSPATFPGIHFSDSYQQVSTQLIYRYGEAKPKSLADLAPGGLHILDEPYYREILQAAVAQYPELSWETAASAHIDSLLQQINQGQVRYGLANTADLTVGRQYYPYLMSAFTLGEPQPLAWAFPAQGDDSLRQAANRFLHRWRENGTLGYLHERYYGHLNRFGFVDKQLFRRHWRERLPKFRALFQAAGLQTGLDWRLLAAMGYQESHWQADAVSPTGVRGLMMLTQATATQVGVTDRTDPAQSILGGADYLHSLQNRLSDRISGDDRLWFAMASYNVGLGHVRDARKLTERQGGNPNLWVDVKQRLPLLRDKKYHSTLPHGYARGDEPVTYVDNIRYYYDLLTWYEQQKNGLGD